MQRSSSLLALASMLIGSLYVSAPAFANPQEAASGVTATAVAAQGSTAATAVSAPAVAPSMPVKPHIALLLPLNSPAFGRAADAVRQGFLAAAGKETKALPVQVYPCNDKAAEVAAAYRQAIANGALAVAGPLTRDGVAAIAALGGTTIPTLALNLIDDTRTDQLYFFGLSPEAEARQIAQRATDAGLLSATIVSTDTPLSRRLADAFAEEWQREGGILQATIIYNNDPTPLRELSTDPGNSVFIAAEADKARLLRPYIDSSLPVYATSQIFPGNIHTLTNYDLSDIRFVDMPWMVQPDHPAVMIYPRSAAPLPAELDRLYALGIDAYRLLQIIYAHNERRLLPLDGVTGKITLAGHTFKREAVPAIMRQGQGIAVESKSRP